MEDITTYHFVGRLRLPEYVTGYHIEIIHGVNACECTVVSGIHSHLNVACARDTYTKRIPGN